MATKGFTYKWSLHEMVYIPIRIEILLGKMNENRQSQKIPVITIQLKYMTSFTVLTDIRHAVSMRTVFIYNNVQTASPKSFNKARSFSILLILFISKFKNLMSKATQ
jgi:hypothetical protein